MRQRQKVRLSVQAATRFSPHARFRAALTESEGESEPGLYAATKPASIAWRSAWYEERTSGPEATWVKPSDMP